MAELVVARSEENAFVSQGSVEVAVCVEVADSWARHEIFRLTPLVFSVLQDSVTGWFESMVVAEALNELTIGSGVTSDATFMVMYAACVPSYNFDDIAGSRVNLTGTAYRVGLVKFRTSEPFAVRSFENIGVPHGKNPV